MASGGPLKDQDLHDTVVSAAPLKWKTDGEARANTWGAVNNQDQTLSAWWGKPAGGTTPYTLKGHFS